jgi:hypothetical protein
LKIPGICGILKKRGPYQQRQETGKTDQTPQKREGGRAGKGYHGDMPGCEHHRRLYQNDEK